MLPELPPIQRRALEGALLIGESEPHADERAVAAAFLGALRLLAADGPLCVAVDDVQWLDAASLAALRYALARLDREPVAALLAVRGDPPAWLRQAVPEERLRVIGVGGLSVGAIHEMLRARLDATFPRPTLIRLWETSQGNPFFALELATALQRRGGTLAPGEELPIPSDLDELLRVRVASLRARGASRSRAPSLRSPIRPSRSWKPPSVLASSEDWPRRSTRGFSSWTASACASPIRCWALPSPHVRPRLAAARCNARLADIVPSAEERARHLALATAEPDGDVASVLEDAARAAHARGAPAAAAELAEQALRLTPASRPDDARRRLLVAAEMHDVAGDIDRATALCSSRRAPGLRRAVERATDLAQLAGSESQPAGSPSRSTARRSRKPRATMRFRPTIHLSLARLMRFSDGIERGIEHGELAVLAAARVGDAALRCRALAVYGLMHFNAGRGIPTCGDGGGALARAVAGGVAARASPTVLDDLSPTVILGHQLWWSADVDRARLSSRSS